MQTLAFTTYIITNARKGTLYTGHTDDRNARMDQHVAGTFEGFSKQHGLKHLVWYEEFETRDEAFLRERRIKEWKRKWKINLIERVNPHWIDLNTVPFWPLPDPQTYPELFAQCLEHRVDPGLRRDERRY
ncbi:MAG: GIY-YIG nuclease family protein [Litorimonas sp.]